MHQKESQLTSNYFSFMLEILRTSFHRSNLPKHALPYGLLIFRKNVIELLGSRHPFQLRYSTTLAANSVAGTTCLFIWLTLVVMLFGNDFGIVEVVGLYKVWLVWRMAYMQDSLYREWLA